MSDSSDREVVRRLYEARGNPDILEETLHRDVRWEAAPGMPYGGVHLGLEALVRDFFTPLFTDFRDWSNVPQQWFETDGCIIVLGHYEGVAVKTAKPFKARFAHFWKLEDGKIVRLQQTADTVQLARALEP